MELKAIIAALSLEEKFALLTGKDSWRTVPVERLGIPEVVMADGPHGLRKVVKDAAGVETTLQAVCFPTSAAISATWNPELARQIGKALGEECGAMGVDILLGPGTNIKRTPLCGRNFEYYSEDPFLAGELAAAYIDGVQSQGVGTSLKHFATNNQEFDRFQISSEVDERALREIYLKPFEIAVKKSQPWTVMCAYNRLNGIYCSENRFLLHDVLRKEWGFKGVVVSDWGAVHNRAKALKAGLELEMPFAPASMENLRHAYEHGLISDAEIDGALERLLTIVFRAVAAREQRTKEYSLERHHSLAKTAALEAITLLKNEDGLLPIRRERAQRIVIIGEFAEKPAFEGGGSSYVNPGLIDSPLEQIKALAGEAIHIDYFPVLSVAAPHVNQLNHAMAAARKADLAIVFVGNRNGSEFRGRDGIESEGYDRNYLTLSPEMELVIEDIAGQNPNTVVVVEAGSAVDMSAWLHRVKAVLFAWYTGEAGGSALAEILFGLENPSGKIAETFPLRLEDTPAYGSYPGNGFVSRYAEGVMVGYRYYDSYHREVLFPFGFGLSYTTFGYSDLRIVPASASVNDPVIVSCKVQNTGQLKGKETVQLYIRDTASKVLRPDKELKAFTKVELLPGEQKEIRFELNRDAFAYFNTSLNQWHVEEGEFEILIGASSRDIRLSGRVYIRNEQDFS